MVAIGTTTASSSTTAAVEGDDVGNFVSITGAAIAYVPVPPSLVTPPDPVVLFVNKNPPLNANNNSINNNIGVLIFFRFCSCISSGSSNPTVPTNDLSGRFSCDDGILLLFFSGLIHVVTLSFITLRGVNRSGVSIVCIFCNNDENILSGLRAISSSTNCR